MISARRTTSCPSRAVAGIQSPPMIDALALEIAGGVHIALPPDPRMLSTCVFLEQEEWFEDEAPFVRRIAEPGGRMLDIGASFASYALSYAKAAGPESRVWAIEPTPEVCEYIRQSARLNDFGNLTVLETAVGAEAARGWLSSAATSEIHRLNLEGGSVEVDVAALDSLDAAHGFGAVDFVKIDVEGHEAAVIAGGREFFTRESPLVMIEVRAEAAFDFTAVDALEKLDYRTFRLIPQFGALAPFSRSGADPYLLNVFACKADRAARLAERDLLSETPDAPPAMAEPAALRTQLHGIAAMAAVAAHLDGVMERIPRDDPSLLLLLHDLASRDGSLPLATRVASLSRAASLARQIATAPASPFRVMSAARILLGWGDRDAAVNAIQKILPAVMNRTECAIDVPFLPPLAAYDAWGAATDPGGWVSASVIEAAALWSSLGIYWSEPFNQPGAELLARYGRATPRLERRRQLRRIRESRQAGVQSHPLLQTKTPENLNPGVW